MTVVVMMRVRGARTPHGTSLQSEDGAVRWGRGAGLRRHLLVRGQLEGCKKTEVQHGGRVVAGSVVGDQIDLPLSLLLLDPQLGPAVAVRTETAEENQHRPQQPEPPELVIVGTAARLSTAVPCFTQVSWVVVYPRTVLGTDNRLATRTPMMLHHLSYCVHVSLLLRNSHRSSFGPVQPLQGHGHLLSLQPEAECQRFLWIHGES